jgi:SAM-dependent methyltransferase
MHKTAYDNALKFYNNYCHNGIENKVVLDVGSYDVNGCLKPIFSKAAKYTGLDQQAGPNVDLVSSSHHISLPDNSVDIVVSSSCFEHDNMFWLTFCEICRVCRPGGYIYINAPSNGPYHGYPVDNWRFYADAWKALENWSVESGVAVKLLDSYVDPDNGSDIWRDSVGIYFKPHPG